MSNELRAAAERLRQTHRDVDAGGTVKDEAQCLVDHITLSCAYLAEHPADDDEPVTESWQDSVFGTDDSVCLTRDDEWGEAITWLDRFGRVLIPMPKTRGKVRQLFAALGIPLKEKA